MDTATPTPVVFRRGKKVILRPFNNSDAPTLHRWMNDPEVTQFLLRTFPLTLHEEEEWIANLSKRTQTDVALGIEVIGGPFIGTIGLHHIDWVHRRATTGTCIGSKEHWSGGYGTDAKMLLLDFAFNTLGLHKVCSGVLAFNSRSLRYNEKCGYKEEGRLRRHIFRNGEWHDEVLLAVFREDWLPLWQEYQNKD